MSDVPDEAVQAALRQFWDASAPEDWVEDSREEMRAALAAALPHLTPVEQEWDRAYIHQLQSRIRELEDAVSRLTVHDLTGDLLPDDTR